MNTTVYILGILLQSVAAIIALLQVRHAPRKLPWLLIALSSLLIVARRVATLDQFMKAGRALATAEILTLIVSVFFFLGVIFMSRMFRDILSDNSARKRAEEALRAASHYSRNLIETSLDPLVTISANGKITDVNMATEKITGIDRERLIGSDFSDYFTEPEKARDGYMKVFEQGQVIDYPLAVRNVSGAITEVLYNASVYRNEQGEILGVFAAARDITERKRAEAEKEKLELQNRQLQKAESLSRMAGAIAHHFNNQLHAVMMNLQMAVSDLPNHGMAVENLTDAMLSARKAAKVSTLMLTYLGQTNAKHEPLYLCEACQQQLPTLRADMPKDVVLETDFMAPGPIIHANANQIQQVLANLVTNAWEALGNTRSAIRVAIKTVCAAEIPVENRFPVKWQPQAADCGCLEVTDAGCGIAAGDIEKVFDPFFSSKFTGRGLGLSVVLGIVRAHNGGVTVKSQPGRGSVFRVFLPLSAEAVPQKPAPVAQAPRTARSGTVLEVDDEPVVLKSTELVLKRAGFTVLTAVDGVDALEMFQQHRDEIGCVLCDLTMPCMNGWETLTAMRKLSPSIPIILASGYSEEQVMAGEHPEMPEAFLSKPYQFETLMDAIARVMRKPKELRKQD